MTSFRDYLSDEEFDKFSDAETVNNDAEAARQLNDFLDHPNISVRVNVARQDILTVEQLEYLSQDDSSLVRNSVVANSATPLSLCNNMMNQPWNRSKDFLLSFLNRENIDEATMMALYRLNQDIGDYPSVRHRLCDHPDVHPQILVDISEDEERIIRYTALTNPKIPAHALVDAYEKDPLCWMSVARNPGCPTSLLEKMYFNIAPFARPFIASHDNAPEWMKDLNSLSS